MISVEEALSRVVAAFTPLPTEIVSLTDAHGRVLAEDVVARVTQPFAPLSAMDGYAVRATDVATAPVTLRQIGSVQAGSAFDGVIGAGETVRIFTGAPLPAGADAIVIQEDTQVDGDIVFVREAVKAGRFVRAAGLDFSAGDIGIPAGRLLGARDIGLTAAMNVPWLKVRRRPRVAILATGDEVVMPGDPVGPNQIVSSNSLALAALVRHWGGEPVNLGIAKDTRASLSSLLAGAEGADLLLTTGGASVGEYDLVREVLGERGLSLDFWKIAMRPGKPLMFGRVGSTAVLGLPGNPVSALVCAFLFVGSAMRRMLGVSPVEPVPDRACLGADIGPNDRRQDYLRASLTQGRDGRLIATPFPHQDSSMMTRLTWAGCLIVRPPHAAAASVGTDVDILRLDGGL